jgi:hypothetical protein
MYEVGFFSDLPHGLAGRPALADVVGRGDPGAQHKIAGYLDAGTVVRATDERLFDVISAERTSLGALSVLTDGVWIWPSDLAYYVRRHNVGVPVDLVEWARMLDWRPPPVDELDVKAASFLLELMTRVPGEAWPAETPMEETDWDVADVVVTIHHPFGTLDEPLTQWMRVGPGPRRFVRPSSARSRSTGQTLPLTVIPLAYRNDRISRALIAAGKIRSPWPTDAA